mmetsp:Transcript_7041/g.10538  ORF Transcript_7041/g.10538 Transcript_7041/m.10538 type:complete len:205 (+) Transcript_7041:45-659(+)
MPEMADKIGFTSFEKWLSFSPVKNSLEAGRRASESGVPPNTASSAEADFYRQSVKKLQAFSKLKVKGDPTRHEFGGVDFEFGPKLILSPNFALTCQDIKKKISGKIKISSTSTALISGENVEIKSLHLEGSLIIVSKDDSVLTVDNLTVLNKGYFPENLPSSGTFSEADKVRGFVMRKMEDHTIEVNEKGKWTVDGSGKPSREK